MQVGDTSWMEPVGTEMKNHIVKWIQDYFIDNGPDSVAVVGISGGKDSSVVAALCVEALGKDRVLGVKMPEGKQHDIDYSNHLIEHLGIDSLTVDIRPITDAFRYALGQGFVKVNEQVNTNLPARVRMAVLYAVAAGHGGRVANTCNRSEDYVGYSTKFGDAAGDFSPLANYTVEEVLQIGEALDLPTGLLEKVPEDGLSGKTDEDNLGFSYKTLDNYILRGIRPDFPTLVKIKQLHDRNWHKLKPMPKCPPLYLAKPIEEWKMP